VAWEPQGRAWRMATGDHRSITSANVRYRSSTITGRSSYKLFRRKTHYTLVTLLLRPCAPQGVTVEQKTRKRKSRVGEPSPRRDPVGTALPEGETVYCSFSGPIQLAAARWLESTVEVVQCPTYGSVSKAKIKGQSVVITPHRPRKARPVRNVTHWMEQGLSGRLSRKKSNPRARSYQAKRRACHGRCSSVEALQHRS
jgi:hypothetical protein